MFLQELLNSNLVVPSTFNIGPFTIAFYALCILTGIVVGMYLVLREAKRVGISSDDVYFFAVITIPVAIVCARIWYVLFNISSFSNFGEVLGFKNGEFTGLSGLAIQGGIIGAVGTLIGLSRFKGISIYKVFDIAMPGILVAQAFGRWGNFFNHELYGPVIAADAIKWFPFLADNMWIDGAYHHPVFLYESSLCLLGAGLMMVLRRKFKKLRRGDMIGLYLIWYGLVRCLTESLRLYGAKGDPLMLGPIPVSLALSVLFIISGIAFLIAKRFFGPQDYYIEDVKATKKNHFDAVIFDLDGTLLDTKELITKTFVHTFEKFRPGYILSDSEVDSFFGPTLKETFSKYSESEEEINEMIAYYREYNKEHHDEYAKVFPGAKETLKQLKQKGYDIAIVSSKKSDMVSHGLEYFKLLQYVDIIIGEEEITEPKPSPEGIFSAIDQLIDAKNEAIKASLEVDLDTDNKVEKNTSNDENNIDDENSESSNDNLESNDDKLIKKEDYHAIYVGDTLNDIKAAHNANIKACGVLYIKDPSIMLEAKPDYVINKLTEIINIVGE